MRSCDTAGIVNLGKPPIAAFNGCAPGGCETAMACTIRIAVDAAKFGQPEVTLCSFQAAAEHDNSGETNGKR